MVVDTRNRLRFRPVPGRPEERPAPELPAKEAAQQAIDRFDRLVDDYRRADAALRR